MPDGVNDPVELLLLLLLLGGGAAYFMNRSKKQREEELEATRLADAQTDARRWIERLGSQVLSISGSDAASTQAIADASERYNAASSAISQATTVKQAELARESALEGMHYMNAARDIMGMTPGPELPPLEGQRRAGKVTEHRTITHEGQTITASPEASEQTPHYHPGGMVAGRPVPAGYYSSAWWAPALMTGMWAASSMFMFSAMFAGMSGVNYGGEDFASGSGDPDVAGEDMGGMEDMDGMDDAGGDMGGGDDGGGFFGGGDDGGLFDGGFDFDF